MGIKNIYNRIRNWEERNKENIYNTVTCSLAAGCALATASSLEAISRHSWAEVFVGAGIVIGGIIVKKDISRDYERLKENAYEHPHHTQQQNVGGNK